MQFSIPTSAGQIQVDTAGKPLFILGRNGTGKSALVFHIRNQLQGQGDLLVYVPGSRPSYFDSDSLGMTPNTRLHYRQNSRSWDANPDTRIRPVLGTSRNEKAIYDLQIKEVQYRVDAANDIERNGASSNFIELLQSKASPVDRINRLLSLSNLPVRVVVDNGELKASRSNNIYSISRMSDGERTALILLADVVSAQSGTTFLVDEPELHLHKAIVVPLLEAVITERPDCSVIVSTHELALPREHSDCNIVLVRGCAWNADATSASTWEVDLITSPTNIPQDVIVDILGSRRKILFVEGNSLSSMDQPIYSMLFPNVSVVTRDTCVEVRRAVGGLNSTRDYHHADVFGLVDNDGMDQAFQTELLGEGVYALPIFSVESLYYCDDILNALVEIQGKTLGIRPSELLSNSNSKCLEVLCQPGKIAYQAARLSERQMRDSILKIMPNRDTIISSAGSGIQINVTSNFNSNVQRLNSLISAGDVSSIIRDFPVRESGALGEIAKALRFSGESDYRKAALTAINNDNALRDAVRAKLGPLAAHLQ